MAETSMNIQGDPVKTVQILNAAGISNDDLEFAENVGKIQTIVDYFGKSGDPELEIARLLKGGVDNSINHLWSFIKMEAEYGESVRGLSQYKNDFDEKVQKEIDGGYLTNATHELIETQIAHLEKEAKMIEEKAELRAEKLALKTKAEKLVKIKEKMKQIDKLKKKLYGK